MRLAYFPNQTPMKSELIWSAFLEGAKLHGFIPVEGAMDADCAVIWSVLWQGRMRNNQKVYEHYRRQGKPVYIIEVGALKRGETWKIALNNITSEGIYPRLDEYDCDRPTKLGIKLRPENKNKKSEILLALQHTASLQWHNQLPIDSWIRKKIDEIRQFSDRKIIIRPHPRNYIKRIAEPNVEFETPVKIANSYDVYDLKFDYHCVINHNSGPGIQAAINGCPIICDKSSLAYPVSSPINQINDLTLNNRDEWLIKVCHT